MWGRLSGFRALVLLALITAPCGSAQTPSKEQFDDLQHKALAVLDAHPDRALDLLKQALAIRPDWAEGWLYTGGALYRMGRFAEATDALHKGLDLAPVFANGWALLGLCESQLDDPEQALADIRKGEAMGIGSNPPFDAAVRVRAAQLLILSSAFDEALAQLQPLTTRPNEPGAVEELMGLCVLGSAEDLTALKPERRAAVDLAGKAAWAFAARQPNAADGFRQLAAQFPAEPGVHYAYGLFLLQADPNSAMTEFQTEVEKNPKHWLARLAIASIELHQGAPEKAIETIHAATQAAPTKYRWLCHLDLGRANLQAKNATAAIAELQDALRQAPSNAEAHLLLAQAYRSAGRPAEAEKEQAAIDKAKAAPNSPPALPWNPFGLQEKN